MGILYIVGTPIGNLGDLTYRGVEILRTVDVIACEDTRRTLKLLSHFGIRKPLVSCRAGNEARAGANLVRRLRAGESGAYVSDAGTPGVSDPGPVLVRLAVQAGQEVIPVPGVSAYTALVSVSGGRDKSVLFEGFLSPKPGRRRARLKELLDLGVAFVLYESPFRILKVLEDLVEFDKERYLCVGREMTKVHEEYLRGSPAELYSRLAERNEQIGEFSIFVSGNKTDSGVN
jgi:16S rRNA (cytidine1402-2'-O)-methyltransferase